ncbi:DsbC family protein [Thiohalomonas denitrificans]|uniref:Thiol:disulfide interchange protein n=1 Tax=Thiohalomonas denitrificans TaxID=415747 RepID=A0A1G5PJL8_9GAMM|nr:DsbC family protein [Thiohalomonas denitrificans]SCZ49702.1 thiol:disulfide interchange protein DsbC [Thiohalomonas denitrificans]
MKRILLSLAALVLTTSAGLTVAAPAELKSFLSQMVPGQAPDAIEETPLPGIYQVVYGSDIFYFSEDGRYMLRGDLVDLKSNTNLSEQTRSTARKAAVSRLDEETMIVYPAKGTAKHVVTVFTDIDCPYCRKLHDGMEEMNEMGIEIRYLAFPRAGIGSSTFRNMASIWCAEDPRAAMDSAKSGGKVEAADCDHGIEEHMKLVRELGINGTPALILDDGRLIGGYVPPKKLLPMLEGNTAVPGRR